MLFCLRRRLVAGFVVREVAESPAASRSIPFGILDHYLDIHSSSDNERVEAGAWKAAS